MGCDIHAFVEVKKEGKWVRVDEDIFDGGESSEPFGIRSYNRFSFLADVRNDSGCVPLSEPKGLPNDSEYLNIPLDKPQRFTYSGYDNGTAYNRKGEIECDANYHSLSWLTLAELVDFDYEKEFENLRVSKVFKGDNTVMMGSVFDKKANAGDGTVMSYRHFLGQSFFEDIEILKTLGSPNDVRIVFWFDN